MQHDRTQWLFDELGKDVSCPACGEIMTVGDSLEDHFIQAAAAEDRRLTGASD